MGMYLVCTVVCIGMYQHGMYCGMYWCTYCSGMYCTYQYVFVCMARIGMYQCVHVLVGINCIGMYGMYGMYCR